MRGEKVYQQLFENTTLPSLKFLVRQWNYGKEVEEEKKELDILKNITDLGDSQHDTYAYILNEADNEITKSVLQSILGLLQEYQIEHTVIPISKTEFYITKNATAPADIRNQKPILAVCIGQENPTLYIFKKYGIGNRLPDAMLSHLKNEHNCRKHKYISLVEGNAYSEILNHTDDEEDPSRGTNIYNLKYFFDEVFDNDEYVEFRKRLTEIINCTQDYYGFSIVKNLKPNSLMSYRNLIRRQIENFPYYSMLDHSQLSDEQYKVIYNNFKNNAYYAMLYGTNDFAQSFITSEWMFNSLEGAGNIDLAPISMSFFKSVEQFLFLYVSCHTADIDQNSERSIYNSSSMKDEPLTSNYLHRKKKYITLGPLCGFFGRVDKHGMLIPKNMDLLYSEINESTYDYIIRHFTKVFTLRNGNSHKDNITDPALIKLHRDSIFLLYFLFFGSYQFRENELSLFGISSNNNKSDLQRIYEYFDEKSLISHPLKLPVVYLERGSNPLRRFIPSPDPYVTFDKNGTPQYSGAYFVENISPTEGGKQYKFNETNLPDKIYEGWMIVSKEDPTQSTYTEPKLIFENGKMLL